jgi:hypothetical protein
MFIASAITSFLLNHWAIALGSIVAIGIIVRIAYYASNPLVALTDTIEYCKVHWKLLLVIVVLAIPALYALKLNATIKLQEQTLTKQAATIAQDVVNIKTLNDNATTLKAAITDANAMIAKFDKFSADSKAAFNKINQTTVTQNVALAKQLQNVLHEKTPLTCEDSIKYLITAKNGYAK